MLSITQQVLKQIIDHAQSDLPNEACGYLAGKNGVVTHSFPLTNIDHSPEHFSFDPAEQFKTVKEARALGLEILANYHSHPSSPARPSEEDIRLAYDPGISYVIVSLAKEFPEIKTYVKANGTLQIEDLRILD
ncbi:MAG: M67 family metallopeptidase [Breznakibacter sp.]